MVFDFLLRFMYVYLLLASRDSGRTSDPNRSRERDHPLNIVEGKTTHGA